MPKKMNEPNQPDAPNPARAFQFHVARYWPGVGEPDRSTNHATGPQLVQEQ